MCFLPFTGHRSYSSYEIFVFGTSEKGAKYCQKKKKKMMENSSEVSSMFQEPIDNICVHYY